MYIYIYILSIKYNNARENKTQPELLVNWYVVLPQHSNRKCTVSKKTTRRADCIEWHYLTQETQHYVSFEVFVL